ncbi:hypothetical protein SISNIDRAFT_280689 [Sistotremastrum niveocremeum HHB9708]|uniref:Uncharacterized protein n=1 Tax=Sistotremastrum niveocremeum HHB9708 TaxID=1314777 RepID=A0A164NRQ6_9AGAM|nr:hypothetical protein SISNIDRAFT_280689 [Sistotremastrum niveocremeum HHB9708]
MPSEGRVYEDSTEKPYVSGDGSTTSVSPCALQAATEDASLRPSSPQREMQNSSAHAPDVSMPTPPATCIPSASITTSSSLLSHELRVTIPERPNVSIGERTRELSPSFFHHDLRMHVISLEGLSAQETELVMKDLWALRDAGSISVAADAHSPYLLHVQWVSLSTISINQPFRWMLSTCVTSAYLSMEIKKSKLMEGSVGVHCRNSHPLSFLSRLLLPNPIPLNSSSAQNY